MINRVYNYRTWLEATLVLAPLDILETTARWIVTSVPGTQTVGTWVPVRYVGMWCPCGCFAM